MDLSLFGGFVLGLFLLLTSALFLVKATESLSVDFRISPVIVGAIFLGIGTSLPEFMVGVTSALVGLPSLPSGNIVGATLLDLTLIFGIVILSGVFVTNLHKTQIASLALVLSATFYVSAGFFGGVSRFLGLAFLLAALFMIVTQLKEGEDHDASDDRYFRRYPRSLSWPLSVILPVGIMAILGLFLGSKMIVESSAAIARTGFLPLFIFGETFVSIGTTLPELATSLVAVAKKESRMAIGNILGSGIYNILLVGGSAALISGQLPFQLTASHLALLASTIFLFWIVRRYRGERIPKKWGHLLIFLYAVYLVAIFLLPR